MNEAQRGQDERSRIRALIEEVAARPDHTGPIRKIAIVSTQRSGSTYLGDMLSSTGLMPPFEEWFNRSFLRTFAQLHGIREINIERYSEWVIKKVTSRDGQFTVKLHVNHLLEMESVGFDLFKLHFDFTIGMARKDKLAQALSLAKARMTEKWRHDSLGRRPDVSVSEISNEMLFASLADISRWDSYFDRHLSRRMTTNIAYEDVVSDPSQVATILRQLGFVVPIDFELSSCLKKQSDESDSIRLATVRRYLGLCPRSDSVCCE